MRADQAYEASDSESDSDAESKTPTRPQEHVDPASRVRSGLEDSRREAAETWEAVEKELVSTLRRRQLESPAGGATSPLLKPSDRFGASLPSKLFVSTRAGLNDAELAEFQAARTARLAEARDRAPEVRRGIFLRKSLASGEKRAGHTRKRLRLKLVNLLLDLQRRQKLQTLEDQRTRAREQRCRRLGLAKPDPSVENIDVAVGLGGIVGASGPRPGTGGRQSQRMGFSAGSTGGFAANASTDGDDSEATPRRACILDAFTLEELDMLRTNPWFFFDGVKELMAAENTGGSVGSGSRGNTRMAEMSVDGLIDFFLPSREDAEAPIAVYAKRLRARLGQPSKRQDDGWAPAPPLPAVPPPPGAYERMACQGRRPQVRDDAMSPTLQRVRAVYNKRDVQEERLMEDRRETMERRHALNAFKANEQQREEQLKILKHVELHSIRMAEAEERKAVGDAAHQDMMDSLEADKLRRLLHAKGQANKVTEDKRDKATASLDVWRVGVERANDIVRGGELGHLKGAEQNWVAYLDRLVKIGAHRHHAPESRHREDDRLKARIQSELMQQLTEQRQADGAALAATIENKLEAAAARRQQALLGARYNLVERAFGQNALGFDAKHHSVHIDRRSPSWRKNAETWELQKYPMATSASAPSLGAA